MSWQPFTFDPAIDRVDGHAKVGGNLLHRIPPVLVSHAIPRSRHQSVIVTENRTQKCQTLALSRPAPEASWKSVRPVGLGGMVTGAPSAVRRPPDPFRHSGKIDVDLPARPMMRIRMRRPSSTVRHRKLGVGRAGYLSLARHASSAQGIPKTLISGVHTEMRKTFAVKSDT